MRLPLWLADRLMPWRLRAEARAKARELLAACGSEAYAIARAQAWSGPRGARGSRDRFWTAVAIAIAEAEGREIGVSGTHRWPDAGTQKAPPAGADEI